MRKVFSFVGYPLLLAWPVAVSIAALDRFPRSADPRWAQVQEGGLFLVIAIPVVAVLLFLERTMAAQPEQRPTAVDVRTDLTNLAMCWFVLNPIGIQGIRLLALTATAKLFPSGPSLWPSGWPMLGQLALAVVVGELGTYWFHRLGHETGLGWKVHAVHHGATHVYWLNSTRFHALEPLVRTAFQIGPLLVLGCTPDAFLVYGIFTAIHGWVQHSNVAYRTGPLDYLMATPRNHRWHHSTVIAESNTNYGLIVALWDHVFGSFFSPRDRAYPAAIGISDFPDFPRGYLGQFLVPFAWQRLLKAQPAARG